MRNERARFFVAMVDRVDFKRQGRAASRQDSLVKTCYQDCYHFVEEPAQKRTNQGVTR